MDVHVSSCLRLNASDAYKRLCYGFPQGGDNGGDPHYPSVLPVRICKDATACTRSARITNDPTVQRNEGRVSGTFVALRRRFTGSHHTAVITVGLGEQVQARRIKRDTTAVASHHDVSDEVRRALRRFPDAISIARADPRICLPDATPADALVSAAIRNRPTNFNGLKNKLQQGRISQVRTMRVKGITIIRVRFLVVFRPFLRMSFLASLRK